MYLLHEWSPYLFVCVCAGVYVCSVYLCMWIQALCMHVHVCEVYVKCLWMCVCVCMNGSVCGFGCGRQ